MISHKLPTGMSQHQLLSLDHKSVHLFHQDILVIFIFIFIFIPQEYVYMYFILISLGYASESEAQIPPFYIWAPFFSTSEPDVQFLQFSAKCLKHIFLRGIYPC